MGLEGFPGLYLEATSTRRAILKMNTGNRVSCSLPFLLSRIQYNPNTGEFIWLTNRSSKFVGKPAGWWLKSGYRVIQFGDDKYLAHRIAWTLMTGGWPTENIDHRDGNPRHNVFGNLRAATQAENVRNKTIQRNCKSGVQGVVWRDKKQKWMAYINRNGRFFGLGYFDTLDEAADARRVGALRIHGEFAYVARPS